MKNNTRYAHTNIISKDWKKIAQFFIDVFECTPTDLYEMKQKFPAIF